MERIDFKKYIIISPESKTIFFERPLFMQTEMYVLNEFLNFYYENYRDYKIIYSEKGEYITPGHILQLFQLHEFFLEKKINTKKIIIFYENKTKEYENLLGYLQFTFYYYPFNFYWATPDEFFVEEFELPKNFNKKFISFNKTKKEHRCNLEKLFEENNIKENSYYSFRYNNNSNTFLEDDLNSSFCHHHSHLVPFYKDAFCNIVTETQYESNVLSIDSVFISEKTFRVLASSRPFIIIGQKHVLRNLHNLGFKTFNDIIDESYDDANDNVREKMIYQEILKLNTKSNDELYELWDKCRDIYRHNRQLLLNLAKHYESNFKDLFPKEFDIMFDIYFQSIQRISNIPLWESLYHPQEYPKIENN